MPSFRNYLKIRAERASLRGRQMAKARWDKRDDWLSKNPPPVVDAVRVADSLRQRRGQIAYVHDIADVASHKVDTWVMRYSVKGRCDQFDLTCNGVPMLTGGLKRCHRAMMPEFRPLLRYD